MKRIGLFLIVALTASTLACSPLEQNARNTAAALSGALSAAQTQYQASCTSNPKQNACTVINQAIAGQDALVTAIEGYCGWSTAAPPSSPATATCAPIKTAAAGLQAAVNNATLFITELKGLVP